MNAPLEIFSRSSIFDGIMKTNKKWNIESYFMTVLCWRRKKKRSECAFIELASRRMAGIHSPNIQNMRKMFDQFRLNASLFFSSTTSLFFCCYLISKKNLSTIDVVVYCAVFHNSHAHKPLGRIQKKKKTNQINITHHIILFNLHPFLLHIFSEISYCFGYQMAPSTGKSPMGTQTSSGSQKISTEILVGWPPQNAPPKVS